MCNVQYANVQCSDEAGGTGVLSVRRGPRALRRGLRALHRWLGAALSGMFVLWFGSGLVLVFAGFPRLDDERRLQALPELALDGGARSPAEVLARGAGPTAPVGQPGGSRSRRVRLGMLGTRPVYRVVETLSDPEGAGPLRADDAEVVDARDGARVASAADATLAWSLAEPFLAGARAPDGQPDGRADGGWHPGGLAAATRLERRDQWTLTGPAAAQFPLVRLAIGDRARTEIFVSTRTAEVVQLTTRRTRTLAWLGAIPHWIYPLALRRHAGAWRRLVLALATAGLCACLSGLALGLWPWRARRLWQLGRRAAGQPAVPLSIRRRWLRWHHLLGLAFGGLAAGWVGSGALSLEPLSGGHGDSPPATDRTAFAGGPLDLARFARPPADALRACQRHLRPRELELVQVAAHPFYLCRQSPTRTLLLDASGASEAGGQGRLDVALALAAMRRVWPDAEVAPGAAGGAGDVDVLRVVSPGAPGAEYQLDLRTGLLDARSSRATRFEQAAFRALHRLELPGLPAGSVRWYVTVVGLSLVGLAFSSTGLVLAVAWARREAWRRDGQAGHPGQAGPARRYGCAAGWQVSAGGRSGPVRGAARLRGATQVWSGSASCGGAHGWRCDCISDARQVLRSRGGSRRAELQPAAFDERQKR